MNDNAAPTDAERSKPGPEPKSSRTSDAAGAPPGWRRPLAGFLAIVAAFSLVLAVTSTWMRATVFNTDVWVESVATLPSNPELQSIVATKVADEALLLIDLPTRLDDAIGPVGRFLAGPVEDASRGFLETATTRVIGSSQFEAVWIETNRLAHEAVVKVLRGEQNVANVTNGQVNLDLAPIINNVVAEASKDAPDFFGGAITIPEVTPDEVDQAATRLAGALGITIPSGFGQVQVFDANTLTSVQRVIRWLDDGVFALWVLFGISIVGALVATIDRRRTVASLGVVTSVAAVGVWLLHEPLQNAIIDQITDPSGRVAAQIVIDTALWRNLGALIWGLVSVALLATAVAWLVGPSASAESFRRTVSALFRGDEHPQTPASLFIRRHVAAFRVGGAVAAVVALYSLTQLTWAWFLIVAIVLAAYEAAWLYVEPAEKPPAEGTVV